MKVLFSTYPTSFSIPGGGEVQISNTKNYLEKLGVTVDYFDIYSPVNPAEYDLLHIFSVCTSMEYYANWAVRNNLPYVVSPIVWPVKYTDYERNRIRHILLNAKLILPNSNAEIDKIIKILAINDGGQFVSVINGIGKEEFSELDRDEKNIDSNFILNIANIDVRKNLSPLAEACKQLGLTLYLAGRIREVPYFEDLTSAYRDTIRYLGPVINGSEYHLSLLKKARAFALPSAYETPGIAAIEAGAAGVPVLLTEVGAGPEYFGDFATYCNPESVSSIQKGLEEIMTSAKTLPLEARRHFSSYTWRLAAEQTLAAYRKIIA